MPGMTGVEVCQRSRRSCARRGDRIAAVTGWGTDADRKSTVGAGCDSHLVKPLAMAVLVAEIAIR